MPITIYDAATQPLDLKNIPDKTHIVVAGTVTNTTTDSMNAGFSFLRDNIISDKNWHTFTRTLHESWQPSMQNILDGYFKDGKSMPPHLPLITLVMNLTKHSWGVAAVPNVSDEKNIAFPKRDNGNVPLSKDVSKQKAEEQYKAAVVAAVEYALANKQALYIQPLGIGNYGWKPKDAARLFVEAIREADPHEECQVTIFLDSTKYPNDATFKQALNVILARTTQTPSRPPEKEASSPVAAAASSPDERWETSVNILDAAGAPRKLDTIPTGAHIVVAGTVTCESVSEMGAGFSFYKENVKHDVRDSSLNPEGTQLLQPFLNAFLTNPYENSIPLYLELETTKTTQHTWALATVACVSNPKDILLPKPSRNPGENTMERAKEQYIEAVQLAVEDALKNRQPLYIQPLGIGTYGWDPELAAKLFIEGIRQADPNGLGKVYIMLDSVTYPNDKRFAEALVNELKKTWVKYQPASAPHGDGASAAAAASPYKGATAPELSDTEEDDYKEAKKMPEPLPTKAAAISRNPSSLHSHRLNGKEKAVQPPDDFCCSISFEIMENPVMIAGDTEGHTYDRSSLEQWTKKNSDGDLEITHPVTQEKFTNPFFIPNRALKNAIDRWKKDHGYNEAQNSPSPQ